MDVAAWLRELGLERYEPTFRENEIDWQVLPELTEGDLKDLGIPLGPRKKLLKAIAGLATGPTAGAKIAAAGSPAAVGRQPERRQLTALFCDLVGSTELAGGIDPEDTSVLIGAYRKGVAGEVMRFDGNVAKFMCDGVLTYFGWPRAHEDQAGEVMDQLR